VFIQGEGLAGACQGAIEKRAKPDGWQKVEDWESQSEE
jgi:hypothetical protein